jgi:hypothetical protein
MDIGPDIQECSPLHTGDSIENTVEGNLGAFRIAVLAEFDQSFRSTQCRGFNEHDDLLFWRGVKVIAAHDRRETLPLGHHFAKTILVMLWDRVAEWVSPFQHHP